ncbi:MAG: hypothetical protein U0T81_10105 [Saprospiraceae bacterium]
MTLPTKLMLTIITSILLCSFTPRKPWQFLGTYGVSAMDTSDIQLTIQPDHTFIIRIIQTEAQNSQMRDMDC